MKWEDVKLCRSGSQFLSDRIYCGCVSPTYALQFFGSAIIPACFPMLKFAYIRFLLSSQIQSSLDCDFSQTGVKTDCSVI